MPDGAPSVSVVLPTLNAERLLGACLQAVREQDYDGAVEIILADGGSTDGTLELAARWGVDRVVPNPLRSGEAGKAVGVKAASGDLILLLDSDNVLVGRDWLARMVRPFREDPDVLGCEPASFTHRRDDHFVNRWHALLGAADPLTIYTGNYARDCVLTGTWTGLPHGSERRDGWDRIELDPAAVPVLGANGYIARRRAFELVPVGDYLFDLDHVHDLVAAGHRIYARADVGIHHAFCDSVATFRRKTRRRVDDFFYFSSQGQRSYPWAAQRRRGIVDFALSTALVAPVVRDAVRGYRRAGDLGAWCWHPFACGLTLAIYAAGVLRGRLRPRMLSRDGWRQ